MWLADQAKKHNLNTQFPSVNNDHPKHLSRISANCSVLVNAVCCLHAEKVVIKDSFTLISWFIEISRCRKYLKINGKLNLRTKHTPLLPGKQVNEHNCLAHDKELIFSPQLQYSLSDKQNPSHWWKILHRLFPTFQLLQSAQVLREYVLGAPGRQTEKEINSIKTCKNWGKQKHHELYQIPK